MKAFRSTKRATKAALLLAAALCLGAIGASLALATTIHLGGLEVQVEAKTTPSKLSKTKPTPLTLHLEGHIATTDGSPVPALKTLNLQFDKHGSINTKGLPTCTTQKLISTTTQAAEKACKSSLIGKGKAGAEIYFPEQAPFSASGPMLIFNGPPKGHNPVLIIHVYADVPAPTTFVTTGEISKAHGKYGTATSIQIPTIVGGQGSLTGFEATLGKTWKVKGKKQSLLTADCPTGSLFAHGEFAFTNGTTLSGEIAKSCG
jgi:hypothetical protein